jgi:hypothetical protein
MTPFRISFLAAVLAAMLLLPGCKKATDTTPSQEEVAAKQSETLAILTEESEKPPLALNYDGILNMGKVYSQEKAHGVFTVTNVSRFPQTIKRVFPTCNCIVLDENYSGRELQPGEALEIGFTMDASTVTADSYARNIQIDVQGAKALTARIGGYILPPAILKPGDSVELGDLRNPMGPWEAVFEIQKNPELPEPLDFGELPESRFFHAELTTLEPGEKYRLTLTSKGPLPYTRDLAVLYNVPITRPAAARQLLLTLNAHVGEEVYFAPSTWKIQEEKLREAGSLTERFAYGEVPGLQEERKAGDPAANPKDMMRLNLLRQKDAIPLRFVKEHHDWDDLFANLEFEVPEGVILEKIRHPKGIELKITVTPESFQGDVREVRILPHRQENKGRPIIITLE